MFIYISIHHVSIHWLFLHRRDTALRHVCRCDTQVGDPLLDVIIIALVASFATSFAAGDNRDTLGRLWNWSMMRLIATSSPNLVFPRGWTSPVQRYHGGQKKDTSSVGNHALVDSNLSTLPAPCDSDALCVRYVHGSTSGSILTQLLWWVQLGVILWNSIITFIVLCHVR